METQAQTKAQKARAIFAEMHGKEGDRPYHVVGAHAALPAKQPLLYQQCRRGR